MPPPSGQTIPHEDASLDVLTETFQQRLFSNIQLLQKLRPLIQCFKTALVQELQARRIKLFIRDNDLRKRFLHQHLLDQGPQQVVLLQQGQAF